MNKTQKKKEKPKGNPTKNTKTKKKGSHEMLCRLEFLQNIAQTCSEQGLTQLSSFYGTSMKTLGKKCVYRIDPNVKRNFCRKCSTAFIPNRSCDIEIIQRPKEYDYVNCKCRTCGVIRKYILNASHKLWETNPDFILKTYEDLQGKTGDANKVFDSSVPSSSQTS